MPLSSDFVVAVRRAADGFPGPFVIPWPMPGALGGLVSFDTFERWHAFVAGLSLHGGIPLIVAAKYARAQKLMLVGWVDPDLMKAAELVGLSALELALRDRYGSQAEKIYGNMRFGHLLRYMAAHDGLTDDKIAMNQRCGGGTVVGLLTGEQKPSLADIRNDGAHGDPFDGFPWSGLLELVRDLIEYAYRSSFPPPMEAVVGS